MANIVSQNTSPTLNLKNIEDLGSTLVDRNFGRPEDYINELLFSQFIAEVGSAFVIHVVVILVGIFIFLWGWATFINIFVIKRPVNCCM